MDEEWQKMSEAAKKVQGFTAIGSHMEAGGVAAAVLAESGKIYTGVCVDTACGLGVCAERNALFNMITNGETKISRVLALMQMVKRVHLVEFVVSLLFSSWKKIINMLK